MQEYVFKSLYRRGHMCKSDLGAQARPAEAHSVINNDYINFKPNLNYHDKFG